MANVTINATKPDGTESAFVCSMDEYLNMQRVIYGQPNNVKTVSPNPPEQTVKSVEPVYTPQVLPPATETVRPYAEFEKALATAGLMVLNTPTGPQIVPAASPSYEQLRSQYVHGHCDGWSGNYNKPNLVTWLGPNVQTEIMRCQMDPSRMLRWAVGIGAAGIGVGVLGSILYLTLKSRATSCVD